MSEIPICMSCQLPFNNVRRMPMILPCHHSLCHNCTLNQYETTSKTTCPYLECKKQSSQLPSDYKHDQTILDIILKRQNTVQNLKKACQALEHQFDRNKEILSSIVKHKKLIKQSLKDLLDTLIFSSTNSIISELQKAQEQIQVQISHNLQLSEQLENAQIHLAEIKDHSIQVDQEVFQLLQSQAYQERRKLEELEAPLVQNFKHVLEEFSILQQSKSEILELQNVKIVEKQKCQQFQIIMTIKKNTTSIISYELSTQKPYKKEMNLLQKTQDDSTQIEQISNEILIISGGDDGNKDYII